MILVYALLVLAGALYVAGLTGLIHGGLAAAVFSVILLAVVILTGGGTQARIK